jgi:Ca2+/Na+ antiporter
MKVNAPTKQQLVRVVHIAFKALAYLALAVMAVLLIVCAYGVTHDKVSAPTAARLLWVWAIYTAVFCALGFLPSGRKPKS